MTAGSLHLTTLVDKQPVAPKSWFGPVLGCILLALGGTASVWAAEMTGLPTAMLPGEPYSAREVVSLSGAHSPGGSHLPNERSAILLASNPEVTARFELPLEGLDVEGAARVRSGRCHPLRGAARLPARPQSRVAPRADSSASSARD